MLLLFILPWRRSVWQTEILVIFIYIFIHIWFLVCCVALVLLHFVIIYGWDSTNAFEYYYYIIVIIISRLRFIDLDPAAVLGLSSSTYHQLYTGFIYLFWLVFVRDFPHFSGTRYLIASHQNIYFSTASNTCPGLDNAKVKANNGYIYPANCTMSQVPYGTMCFLACKKGYGFKQNSHAMTECSLRGPNYAAWTTHPSSIYGTVCESE